MKRDAISWRVRGRVMAGQYCRHNKAFLCTYCLARLNEHSVVIDHVWPVARGGTNVLENLQVTCRRCNEMKGAKTPDEAEEYINEVLEWEATH